MVKKTHFNSFCSKLNYLINFHSSHKCLYLSSKFNYKNVYKIFRGIVFRELHKLYVKHAVPEYLENWPQLVKYCGYREDNLPQLQDINVFLKRKTGFQIR